MRRKVMNFILAAALVLTLVPSAAVHSEADVTVNINPDMQFQTLEGWGTSLCFSGKLIGGWSDKKRAEIADMLFDENKGLGLNIVRYNIGGGENPAHSHMNPDYALFEGYEPQPGVWDWNADANQRLMLQEALKRGVKITEAFSNSPPWWMTKTQCASGAEVSTDNNLKDEYYGAFADYLTEVVKHFRDTWGITFQTLDPLNEPSSSWWHEYGNQEGCHFDPDKQNELIKMVGEKLVQKGLTGTTIAASDETSPDQAINSFNAFDSVAKSYISRINVHEYVGGNDVLLGDIAKMSGKKLWMSEICTDGGVPTNHKSMEPGLAVSSFVTNNLKSLRAEAWLIWQPLGYGNWGLLDNDLDGNTWVTKEYYTYGNYTKFIRPGYKIIGNDDTDTLTAYDEKSKKLVIVHTNSNEDDLSFEYNLSKFGAVGDTVAVYRTSANEDLAKISDLKIKNKILTAPAKGKSVTTYVISGVSNADEAAFEQSKERLQHASAFYIDSSEALVNNNWFNLDNSYNGLVPVIKNQRMLLPVRFLAEKMGGTVNWDKNTAIVKIDSNTIKLTVESKTMLVNETPVKLDTSPQILTNSRLYVPVKAFAEKGLGKSVIYYKGLAIISDDNNLIDLKSEKVLADRILRFFK
jgi:O-glycosyl hydrolase